MDSEVGSLNSFRFPTILSIKSKLFVTSVFTYSEKVNLSFFRTIMDVYQVSKTNIWQKKRTGFPTANNRKLSRFLIHEKR